MDMKEINTMLLERNAIVFQQIKEIFDEGQVQIINQLRSKNLKLTLI